MKLRILTTAAVAATALAISVAAPASARVPAAPSGSLTVFSAETQHNVLDLGGSGLTVGDVVTGSGDVSMSKGGKSVGSFVYRAETVRVNIPGGNLNRINSSAYDLQDGTIMLTGLVSIQQGTEPTKPQPLIIVGGTGKYAGANGTATLVPGKKFYKVTFTFTS